MSAEQYTRVTSELRAAFGRDGVVFLPGLFDAAWVEFMRAAVEAAMAAPGPLADNFSPSPEKGKFYGEHFLWLRHAAFRRIALESPLPPVAAALSSGAASLLWRPMLGR